MRLPMTSARSSSVGSRPIRSAGCARRRCPERAGRLVVDLGGGHADQFALGVAQRGQLAAEHAAGVEADRVVHPLGLGHRRVPVDDHGPAAVVLRPRIPDRHAVLVGLAGGVAVQRERTDGRRRPAVHGLGQPGVRDHQLAVVEDHVTEQLVHERGDPVGEPGRLGGELGQADLQPVGDGDVPSAQRPDQLGLVVAADRKPGSRRGHAHHQPQHRGRGRSPVDQVAHEDRGPALGVPGRGPVGVHRVAELAQQRGQLGVAAVDVTDDVERAAAGAPVVPQRLPLDHRRVRPRPRRPARAPGGSLPGAGRAGRGGAGRAAGAPRAARIRGPAGLALRAAHVPSGTSSTIATAST